MLYYWDIMGVFFFAISGALAGRQKEMDLLGCFIMALVTAVGGGTLRSILIGDVPAFVFRDPAYVITTGVATCLAVFFPSLWDRYSREVSMMDALGLGVFVCIGTDIALNKGLPWWAAAFLGMITATFGGVIRDVFRNEVPLIFRKEIYATAALGGAVCLMLLRVLGMGEDGSIVVATFMTAGVRVLAIRYAVHKSSL